MPKKSEPSHPFRNSTIPNAFYFTLNKPENYNAVDYFRTFADIQCSKKENLHGYWKAALRILAKCDTRDLQSHGQRLISEWNTPSRGVGDFWTRLQEHESTKDQIQSTTSLLKKRAIRSVQKTTLKAFNAVDRNLSFDDDHGTSSSKRQRQNPVLNNDDRHLMERETASVADGVVEAGSQVVEGHDDTDDNLSVEADNFDGALSESSEAAMTPLQPDTTILEPMYAVYYLAGGGDPDCSKERRSPYMVNGVDVSDLLWDYRSGVLEKAERMEPLKPVERLAVSNMYLFEQEHSNCSLFHALGTQHWSAITKSTLRTKVTKDMLSEIGLKAVEISRMTHEDALDHVDNTVGNKEVRRIIMSLLQDKFLWDKEDFNELELVEHSFNPFLKSYFGRIPGCKGRWDKEFQPSTDRRQTDDSTAKGRRPDYFVELFLPGLTCYLVALEAKKTHQTSPTQTDTEKLANLLKDSIDYLARALVDINNIKLFGVVVVGEKATVYTMELPAKGLYIMKIYAVFYVPRSKDDLAVLGTAMDVLTNMKFDLEALIVQCNAPRLSTPSDRTTKSYRSPQKVERTGFEVGRSISPSVAAAIRSSRK